jgi:hypothetical protein
VIIDEKRKPEAFGDPIGELPYENDGTNQFFWVP